MRTLDFTLTDDHVKLLHAMFVGWDDCESGAPAVDPKEAVWGQLRAWGRAQGPRLASAVR